MDKGLNRKLSNINRKQKMSETGTIKLVYTKEGLCKVCYTCVRECPVKAIRILDGQAEVMNELCIGCGNCVKVCSQGAKAYLESKTEVEGLLSDGHKIAAIIAPSFAAEFSEISDYREFVGMIRSLGFDFVNEVAFGADLVAMEYEKLMGKENHRSHISSDCPAIVFYIKHYHPGIADKLAPVVSPMVAITRVLKKLHGNDLKIVFIGPCIAKKAESEEVDASITFMELRDIFEARNINNKASEPSDFDPPHAGKGAIFPVSRGMLQTVNKEDDICEGDIIVAEGKQNFKEAVKEFEKGLDHVNHLELLSCEGCIMGPGMSKGGKRYARQIQIGEYVKEKMSRFDKAEWENYIEKLSGLDLSQSFKPADRRRISPEKKEIDRVLKNMGKFKPTDHLNCGACGYSTCVDHAVAIIDGIAESEMCLPYTIDTLHKVVNDLNNSNEELANTQDALKQSEKLASMGQLSAGIAHELNNPLGVITMYSNIIMDEASENDAIKKDLELIVQQADRCKNIVGGLLNFARKNQVKLVETDFNKFVKGSISSIIHPENVKVYFETSLANPTVRIDQNQMMQVLTNLEKNAVEAMPDGGRLDIKITGNDDDLELNIQDTGIGISKENMDKLFTPFFTTKKPGQGTGLGLSLIYGIVKMHKGQINVISNDNAKDGPTGTNFKIRIPRKTI